MHLSTHNIDRDRGREGDSKRERVRERKKTNKRAHNRREDPNKKGRYLQGPHLRCLTRALTHRDVDSLTVETGLRKRQPLDLYAGKSKQASPA